MTIQNGSTKSLIHGILPYFDGVKRCDGYWKAKCSAHHDEQASLSIREEQDLETGLTKVRLKCHAGCKYDDVLEAAGLERKDLYRHETRNRIVATYDYVNPTGDLLHQTVRFEPKDFKQRRPDGQGGWVWNLKDIEPVLYNLPAVMRAILNSTYVFVLEGEKDCNRASELGLVATTCPMGAESWRASYTQMLHGARVVLIPDNDQAGRQHMDKVSRDLQAVAKSVKRVDLPGLPDKGDLSDWIAAGGTREELLELAEQAPDLFKSDSQGTAATERNKSLPFYTVGQIKEQSGGDNEQVWICPMFMKAGDITLFGGEAKKSGKTTFYMHMLKAVHDGVPFVGMPTVQTNSLVLTEQGGNIIEATNKAKIADDDKILITPYKDVSREEWPHLIELAVECCKENDLGILVIDTFTAFAKLRGSDENLSGEIIERMLPLLEAARVHGLHVSILHHTGYNGEIRGSSAFWKDPDCIWLLKRPPGDHAPNVRALHGEGRYDMVHTGFNIALEENGYVLLGTNSQIERAKAKTTLLERIPVGKDNAVRRTAVFEDLPKPPAEATYQRALEDLIEAHAVQEEALKGRGNPKILWRPQGVPVTQEEKEDDLFKSDPQGTAATERNKSEDSAPEFITDQVQVEALAERARAGAHVALDLEGNLDAKVNRLRDEHGIRVLSLHLTGEMHLLDLHAVDPTPLLKVLEDIPIYVHGAEFDIAALHHRFGFVPKHTPRDTLNLSRLVYAGEEISHSLLDCLERELGDKTTEEERKAKKKFQKPKAWQEELTEEHARYAAGDVDRLAELHEALLEKARTRGLEEIVKQENRARPAFLDMQFNGVKVDTERWIRTCDALVSELDDLRGRLHERLPDPPDEEGWKLDGSGAKRGPKVALAALGYEIKDVQVATLRRLAKKVGDPIVDDLVAYREKSGSLKYVDWPERFFVNGRIHPILNPHGAEDTGRATTSNPNLQGLDKGGEWRRCIRPGPGRKIIRADLAQIELRIMAYVSGDKDLFGALHRGDDIHKMTAEAAVGRELDLEVKEDYELRSLAKRVNFGRFYGAGPRTITKNLNDKGVGVSEKEVRKILKGLADAFPRVAQWQNEFGNRPEFVVKSVMGRRRRVGGFNGKPKYTERLNGPVQTTGTDVLKTALGTLVDERGDHPDISIVLAIHDEVLLEAPAGEKAEEAKVWLEGALRGAVHDILGPEYVGVPGEKSDCAEAKIQDSWGGD